MNQAPRDQSIELDGEPTDGVSGERPLRTLATGEAPRAPRSESDPAALGGDMRSPEVSVTRGDQDNIETLDDPYAERSGDLPGQHFSGGALPTVEPGRYAIKAELAQGGIGRILCARDMRLQRPVALKQLLDPGGSAERRFVRETLVTARLQHPSILPIYDAACWPSGELFYTMRLVSGRSLEELIAETRTLEQRLGLLRHVLAAAEAVAYAHSQRIIHRDLKPANILVGDFGETVVIDWGLAKDLGEREEPDAQPRTEATTTPPPSSAGGLTLAGAVMGTPAYMPPEQAIGEAVDERADVYALGAILYHMLAGTAPYQGTTAPEILFKVIDEPPPPVSAAQKDISEDLLAIVTKAMARKPADRYPTAKELADDLRRFETGQIVGAYRYSSIDLFRRFVRRYKATLAVAAAALVALAAVGAVGVERTIAERVRAEEKQVEAEEARREAVAYADDLILVQARASLERDPNMALAWLKTLSPSFAQWPAARIIAADAKTRGLARVLRGHQALINSVDFSPDGRLVATTSDDHTARVWDVETGTSRELSGHTDEVWDAAFSPDGRRLATGSKDTTARLWDLATGESRVLSGQKGSIHELAFSPDGRRLFSNDGTILSWDLATGARRVVSPTPSPGLTMLSADAQLVAHAADGDLWIEDTSTGTRRTLAADRPHDEAGPDEAGRRGALMFSPDGVELAEATTQGALYVWDLSKGSSRLLDRGSATQLPTAIAPEQRLTFSRDGSMLAALEPDSTVRVWTVATGEARVFKGHEGGVMRAVFSHDGKLLATAGFDHTARLWDIATGRSRVLYGNDDVVMNIAFSPDDSLLATAGADHTLRLFRVTTSASRVLAGQGAEGALSEFSPDGQLLATGGLDGKVRLWDVTTGEATLLDAHEGPTVSVHFSPSGEALATAGSDGALRLWDRSGELLWSAATPGRAQIPSLAFSPNGTLVAAAGADGAVRVYDGMTGGERVLSGHEGAVLSVAFSRDAALLASGGVDGSVRLWNLAAGGCRTLRGHDGAVAAVAFSPDGRVVASGGRDHKLRFWEVDTGESRSADAGGGGVFQIAFSPDGKTLVSAGEADTGVRLWDVATASQRDYLRGHAGWILRFSLSPDGDRLVTTSADKTARLWDLRSKESRALRGHTDLVHGASFSPNGKLIATASADGTVRLWADDLPHDPDGLRAFISTATPDTIDPRRREQIAH